MNLLGFLTAPIDFPLASEATEPVGMAMIEGVSNAKGLGLLARDQHSKIGMEEMKLPVLALGGFRISRAVRKEMGISGSELSAFAGDLLVPRPIRHNPVRAPQICHQPPVTVWETEISRLGRSSLVFKLILNVTDHE